MRKIIKSVFLWIDKKYNKYRYVVTYHDCNGNIYELFFKTWPEADKCAMNALKSGRSDVTLKIK